MGKHYYYCYMIMILLFAFVFGSSAALIANEACININVNITLSYDFYMNSCPEAEAIVFSWVEKAVSDDPRMAASLLRLHFHDCFVNACELGCDASVLLDETRSMVGEKSAGPNAKSLRGLEVIDAIKAEMEYFCPQTVSCADILAIAARDAVLLSGGPRWEVEMGRRDSLNSSKAAANTNIPAPNSDLPTLISKFNNVGLSLKHLVALSGAHTIGKARCSTFTSRLGLDSSSSSIINNLELLHRLQQLCGGTSTSTSTSAAAAAAADLDYGSPTLFDNGYYVNLLSGDGLLPSDQALLMDDHARALVDSYALDLNLFFQDFAHSMLAMGALHNPNPNPDAGQIRRNCHIIN